LHWNNLWRYRYFSLYVLNAITKDKVITEQLILALYPASLDADAANHHQVCDFDPQGDNGRGWNILTLCVGKKQKEMAVIPAMIGGAALIADGMITPPISVTSAVEGMRQ